MTRELKASYRDADNRKYKLYEDEELEQWTIESGSYREFSGTEEAARAFLKEKGLGTIEQVVLEGEVAESTPDGPLPSKSSKESSEPLESGGPLPTEDGSKTEEAAPSEAEADNVTDTPEDQLAALKAKVAELEQ